MNILVTGSAGQIGRYVLRELSAAGHTVTGIDVTRPGNAPGRFLQADLTVAGEIYGALGKSGAEAVVHMGAWADAGKVVDTRTYGDNVSGTFNVFQACADLGIKRIVSASSAQVYGFAGAAPVYVPVDEDHPLRPVNCYALSKVAGEKAADYFVENHGLEILSFRFMGVREPERIGPEIEAMVADPRAGGWLLWTRTDARDAATACRLAVEADAVESGPYNITGPRVVLETATEDLVREYFGDRTEMRQPIPGTASPMTCGRAGKAFGYEPRYAWAVDRRHEGGE